MVMQLKAFNIPQKPFLIQKPMVRVCVALLPLVAAAVYLFGWRALSLTVVVFIFGIVTEALFTFREGKPVTSAVFVTCLIFSLSLPPSIPFWMAIVGIVFGVAIGKMVFGGFGQNVFNPAMAGRCFIYITFPVEMTNEWIVPFWGRIGGFAVWSPSHDALTRATPLMELKKGIPFSHSIIDLMIGNIPGSLGETSAILIILGGLYIIYKKAAPWRLAASCLAGGVILSVFIHGGDGQWMTSPLITIFSGSFLFGTAFVVTEPISGPKTKPAQWIYGFIIGGLTVVLREFSNFSEGLMFSVLLMNAFVPIMDQNIRQIQTARKGAMPKADEQKTA